MRPERQSSLLLGVTRSKAKMYEYGVPLDDHIEVKRDLLTIMDLTIAILGDESVMQQTENFDEISDESKRNLLFSAHYFDSFVESRWHQSINQYLLLIGSAAYYLCDLPGNSRVLADRITNIETEFDGRGLATFLWKLLQKNFSRLEEAEIQPSYISVLNEIANSLVHYFTTGEDKEALFSKARNLKEEIYSNGTPRELLLIDIIHAVLTKLTKVSSHNCLELYTDLAKAQWNNVIAKPTFIKEFWPAQIKIGRKNIYKGHSAIIQMPTSAGKTKAIEIIIRSSFLSERSEMAVVVAPFRALCSEIKGDLTRAFEGENISVDIPPDTFQADFDDVLNFDFESRQMVLILTPEKFLYMLRHAPDLGKRIGLLIYDEGHQFDSGIRGVTYELLLASLKQMLQPQVQIILISAVITNANDIGNWLIGENKELVATTGLSTTYRTIAFTSWKDQLGRLEFIDPANPDERDFFVPRVLESTILNKKKKETSDYIFPAPADSNSIALFLAIKLSKNGSVAVFCGRKSTVNSICELAVEAYDRGFSIAAPASFSNRDELTRLKFLHLRHYGESHAATTCCELGIFTHSGSTPQGIRHAVEYAMKNRLIFVVLCTSTLAQGVNLPIKYLLITSISQSGSDISTRDFHNLIGRAGRSGIHTEGSIIFTNPDVYDRRSVTTNRWNKFKSLLDPGNSEPCSSMLVSLFDPLVSDDERFSIQYDPINLVKAYIKGDSSIGQLIDRIATQHSTKKFTVGGLTQQINRKVAIICAIESYLMTHLEELDLDQADQIERLAKGTLAYFLSQERGDQTRMNQLVEVFHLLANNVMAKISDPVKRRRFGKTLLGVQDLLFIESWAEANGDEFKAISSVDDMLFLIWPMLQERIKNEISRKLTKPELLIDVVHAWISGAAYFELLEIMESSEVKIRAGSQQRKFKHENIVEICDNALAFEATLIVAALFEIFNLQDDQGNTEPLKLLNSLQRRLKYGLPTSESIQFHEIGFSDRILAQDLDEHIFMIASSKINLGEQIAARREEFQEVINKYPSYFHNVLNSICTEYSDE